MVNDPVFSLGIDLCLAAACRDRFEPSMMKNALLSYYLRSRNVRCDIVRILRGLSRIGIETFSKIREIDILRDLEVMADSKMNTQLQCYAKDNISCWSANLDLLSNQDIDLLLVLQVYPVGIESNLEKRKMYIQAAELYLRKNYITDAIRTSNSALATVHLSNVNAVNLVKLWEDELESRETIRNSIPQSLVPYTFISRPKFSEKFWS